MKPLIGITTLIDEEGKSWIKSDYIDMVKYAGGIPIILPINHNLRDIEKIVSELDGFILSGGPDVDPKVYNEEKMDCCGNVIEIRDSFEIPLLLEIYKQKKSFLGICRGFQVMNVVFGGSLYQDIPTQYPSNIIHSQDKPYSNGVHNVEVFGQLEELFAKKKIIVNSHHHQGVKKLASNFIVLGKSEDGIIEAAMINDYPFGLGVQWHPEMLGKDNLESGELFKKFIESCKERYE